MAKPDWGALQDQFLAEHAKTGISPKDWCQAQGLNYASAKRYIKVTSYGAKSQKEAAKKNANSQKEKHAQDSAKPEPEVQKKTAPERSVTPLSAPDDFGLSDQQMIFSQHVVEGKTRVEAYRLAGYTGTAAQVPDDSPSFTLAYGGAVEWVNPDIACVTPNLYTVAVYNLGASFLVNYGTESVFAEFREEYGLNNFKAGVITGAGDNSTSAQRLVPDFFKDLSLADLQMLQDPWGRRYLMIAQQFGSLWGLS